MSDSLFELVLLIDDSEIDNFVTKRIVVHSGFGKNIVIKDTVHDALLYLQDEKSNIEMVPDIIMLDINMPIQNGYAFLEEFEKLDEMVKNKSKIIIVSSSDEHEDLEKMFENKRVFKYIVKPLTLAAMADLKQQLT
ncbi:MAG TPA: response regulator [Cytophagaceae bacterium]|jgi:CheY-like chemotaxis protein